MSYEIVEQHIYRDIYRLSYGVLLIVNKTRSPEIYGINYLGQKTKAGWSWTDNKPNKEHMIKNKDIGKCFTLTSDCNLGYPSGAIAPKGTVIFEDRMVEVEPDPRMYYYEVKTTGSCFSGSSIDIKSYIEDIENIMNIYS